MAEDFPYDAIIFADKKIYNSKCRTRSSSPSSLFRFVSGSAVESVVVGPQQRLNTHCFISSSSTHDFLLSCLSAGGERERETVVFETRAQAKYECASNDA